VVLLVGADLATSSSICAGRPETTPHPTVFRAPAYGPDLGRFGLFWWKTFNAYFEGLERRLEPGEEIISRHEAPILPRPHWDEVKKKMVGGTTIQTTEKLQGLSMIYVTVIAYRREAFGTKIVTEPINLRKTKNELAGHAGAGKDEMVLAARRAGIALPPGDEAKDAADAFAAWLVNVRENAPRQWRDYWDRRIWSGAAFRG
jgi:hypothetical protein